MLGSTSNAMKPMALALTRSTRMSLPAVIEMALRPTRAMRESWTLPEERLRAELQPRPK
jgi:hypothetical protein